MTRNVRRILGAVLALALGLPSAPLWAGHGSSHGGSSHGGGSHGGSHGSHGGSHGGGSHHSSHSGHHGGSRGHSHRSGEWIFFGAPFWGGFGGWYPDDAPPEEGAEISEDAPGDDDGADDRSESLPAGRGMLTFSVQPEDAAVYLDGHLLGTAEEVGRTLRGVPVSPGRHEIAVVRPGMEEWTTELEIADGELRNVEASLDR